MGKESAFGAVLRNRSLRRLQYAVLGSMLGRMAFIVAIAVWAYDAGGPALVGLAGFLADGADGASSRRSPRRFADRYPRERVMAASDGGRALLCLGDRRRRRRRRARRRSCSRCSSLISLSPRCSSPRGPRSSLARRPPGAARRPPTRSPARSTAPPTSSGRRVGAFLLAVSSVEVTFALHRARARLVGRLRADAAPARARAARGRRPEPSPAAGSTTVREGVRVVREDRGLLLLVGLFGVQTLIAGALSVFIVVDRARPARRRHRLGRDPRRRGAGVGALARRRASSPG